MDEAAYGGPDGLRQREKRQQRQAFYIAFYAAMGVVLAGAIAMLLLFLLSVAVGHWEEIQSAVVSNFEAFGGLLILGLIFGYLGIQVIRGWKQMKAAIRQKS